MFGDPFGICENLGDSFWDSDLIDTKVGVRGNDGAAREVDTFPGKVSSKSTLFPFESLTEASHWFLAHLWRNTWQFGIDVHCNRHLKEFPLFLAKAVKGKPGDETRERDTMNWEIGAPLAIPCFMSALVKTISVSLTVMSSSLEAPS